MDKVKLPKEVSKAIERLFQDGWTAPMILRQSIRGQLDLEANQILCKWAEDEWKCEQLAKALFNGYEVEEAPEDKVREYFKHQYAKATVANGDKHTAAEAIIHTLELLGIKIEGVFL